MKYRYISHKPKIIGAMFTNLLWGTTVFSDPWMTQHASGGWGADAWLTHHQLASWRSSGTRTVWVGLRFSLFQMRWTWSPKLHVLVTVGIVGFRILGLIRPIPSLRGTEIWSVQWTAQKAANADGPIQGVRNPRHPRMVQCSDPFPCLFSVLFLYGIGHLTVLWTIFTWYVCEP